MQTEALCTNLQIRDVKYAMNVGISLNDFCNLSPFLGDWLEISSVSLECEYKLGRAIFRLPVWAGIHV